MLSQAIMTGDPMRIADAAGVPTPARVARNGPALAIASHRLLDIAAGYIAGTHTRANVAAASRVYRHAYERHHAQPALPYVPAPAPMGRLPSRAPAGAIDTSAIININPAASVQAIESRIADDAFDRIHVELRRRDDALVRARNGTTRALIHVVSRSTVAAIKDESAKRYQHARFTSAKPAPVNTDCYRRQVTLPAAPTPEKLRRLAADYAAWCKRQERNAKRRAARKAAKA